MRFGMASTPLLVLALLTATPCEVLGQALPPTRRAIPDNYPPALPKRTEPSPPQLAFHLVHEIALPGPLPGGPARRSNGDILVPVEGGTAVVRPGADPRVSIVTADDAPLPPTTDQDPSPWVVGPGGKFRYRSLPEGKIVAERRRRWSKRWKTAWKLRVAGPTLSPPVLLGQRLFFASVDNQVYAVRADNGHRLWASDVLDRVSRRLTLWEGEVVVPESPGAPASVRTLCLILVVPDRGDALIALDPHDGSRVATLDLGSSEDAFLPPALASSDGTVVVARQMFEPTDASLAVYRLAPPEPPQDGSGELTYNEPDPAEGRQVR